ncbi:DUF2263 domain containing protein [Naviculisporaceae sp. PSN 640]
MSSSRPQTPHSPRPSPRAIPRPSTPDRPRNPVKEQLRSICQETENVLPAILVKQKRGGNALDFEKYTLNDLPRLNPNDCPSFPTPATIKVINKDTLDTAIDMMTAAKSTSSSSSTSPTPPAAFKPAVVNFANRHEPGGGWRNGAMAQEEALFYRSSLSLSLWKQRVGYPLGTNDAVYSPHVVIIRNSFADGHQLSNRDDELPVVSVLTVAAINRPETESYTTATSTSKGLPPTKRIFKYNRERNLTKDKMRLVLRMAASKGHTSIVLGALGCGAFENPPEDVAHCWLEVLREDEFSGNWWKDVVFAVFDSNDAQDGNFNIFHTILHGQKV